MRIDSATAHYGLFQIVFADAVEHVADALFSLRVPKKPSLNFSDVFNMRLADQLKELGKELAQFKKHGQSIQEFMHKVCDAASRMDELRKWRDIRIHARVRVTSEGFALFDKKNEKRLFISEIECEEKINEATKIIVDLGAYIPHLRKALDFEKEVRDDAKALGGF
jgi:hypothetical protein